MTRTPSLARISTTLQRIAEVARIHRGEALTSLNQYIDVPLLVEAWRRTRKGGAVGVDGMTAAEYENNLMENLTSLCERFHKGTYRAPPVRRVYIPKGKGKTRPIGIPTLEDKILQRAVAMVLEAVYEQDFKDSSYGFRPRRSAHGALHQVRSDLMEMHGGYVIDMDISAFFDSLEHRVLRDFLDLRVRDGVIRRMIDKWLKAGIMEGGQLTNPKAGTPQGGVISPLLANIFLHHVLDEWFDDVVLPRLSGRATLVRYADDAIIVCKRQSDQMRIMRVLAKRFNRFGLSLHPDKTKVVAFIRPPYQGGASGDGPGTFDFLGFTHYWSRSRRGSWIIKQKTMTSRLSRALNSIGAWCRKYRHRPVREQHSTLSKKLRGHDNYYGITHNFRALQAFHMEVARLWRKWLHRRSQRGGMRWEKFQKLLEHYPLPKPRIMHRYTGT